MMFRVESSKKHLGHLRLLNKKINIYIYKSIDARVLCRTEASVENFNREESLTHLP